MMNQQKTPKSKICKCGKEYIPYLINGLPTSKKCFPCLLRSQNNKKKKPIRAKSDYQKTEDKAWVWVSRYIRKRFSFGDEYCVCYTCKALKHWKDIDAGHYIKRQYKATIFDERNLRPQCRACNRFHGGKQHEFGIHLEEEYGMGILQQLNKKSLEYKRYSISELESIAKEYRQKFNNL